MTRSPLVLAVLLALTQCGCMTMMTMDAARGPRVKNSDGEIVREPQPAYCFLLPLTVPGDIATLPCQFICGWLVRASCSCM
jgi:hypothetical protein